MIEALKSLIKEAEGKTPLDFQGVYEPDSLIDPNPLEVAEKLCELNAIDVDTVSIKELVEFGRTHIQSVWAIQNGKDNLIKQVDGYDISSIGIKTLKALYQRWEAQQNLKMDMSAEEMKERNAIFKNIVADCGKIAYPSYPVQGSTIWEGRVCLIDILLVFNNFEASSLGKSSSNS